MPRCLLESLNVTGLKFKRKLILYINMLLSSKSFSFTVHLSKLYEVATGVLS